MMKIPSVGSTVSVVVRHKSVSLFATSPWDEKHYTGVVVKNAKWIDADSFSLQTQDNSYPVKIINSGYVHDIKIISGKSIDVRKFNVKSKSGTYIVTKSGNNYSCSCVGFKYHSKCKHITAVTTKLG
jgi:hypothetical protein